jgi:hypothetical protein
MSVALRWRMLAWPSPLHLAFLLGLGLGGAFADECGGWDATLDRFQPLDFHQAARRLTQGLRPGPRLYVIGEAHEVPEIRLTNYQLLDAIAEADPLDCLLLEFPQMLMLQTKEAIGSAGAPIQSFPFSTPTSHQLNPGFMTGRIAELQSILVKPFELLSRHPGIRIYGVDYWKDIAAMEDDDRVFWGLRNALMARKVDELLTAGACRTAALVTGSFHLIFASTDGSILPTYQQLKALGRAQVRAIYVEKLGFEPHPWATCPKRWDWGRRILLPEPTDALGILRDLYLAQPRRGTPPPKLRNVPLSGLDALVLIE